VFEGKPELVQRPKHLLYIDRISPSPERDHRVAPRAAG
jgi:hypothetical protein